MTAEFLEAIVMMIYPCVYLKSNPYLSVVHHSAFCDTIGTLTMMTLEYSDFAVFLLAVHTGLVVFSPRCCQGHGLYRFRHSVGFFYFFIPCAFAVICLVPFSSEVRSAYDHLISECYFRFCPRWYRYALSWAPGLFIMAAIIVIYFSIFIYIKNEVRTLEKSISSLGSLNVRHEDSVSVRHINYLKCCKCRRSFTTSVKKWLSQFPGLSFLYPYGLTALNNAGDRHVSEPAVVYLSDDDPALRSDSAELQSFISSENYTRFQRRRSDIERQVRFLFIYPAVYVFVYAFPLTQQLLDYDLKGNNGNLPLAVIVINYFAIFIEPLLGAINSLVFYWRESQSQQLLDRLERPYQYQSAIDRDRTDPSHGLNIQTDFRSQSSDMPSPGDTTTGKWPQPGPSPKSDQQWAARIRDFRFRSSDEEKEIQVSPDSGVKQSRSMVPILEETFTQTGDKRRIPHDVSDDEGEESFDLTEFLQQY